MFHHSRSVQGNRRCAAIHREIGARDVRREARGQEAGHARHLLRTTDSLEPNSLLSSLQIVSVRNHPNMQCEVRGKDLPPWSADWPGGTGQSCPSCQAGTTISTTAHHANLHPRSILTPAKSTPASICPGEMQLIRTPVPLSTATPARTTPSPACAAMV